MPRKKYDPVLPKHITPGGLAKRKADGVKRAHKKQKPRVVAGTAAARALGIK